MQEEENKKQEPMVDIDTSGPGADVELEEQKPEGEVETKEDSLVISAEGVFSDVASPSSQSR